MELINTNNENTFDPTPKLKSSPVPILFIPFNNYEDKCNYCGYNYSRALHSYPKYCKICLFKYIKDITDRNDVNTYLDVHISVGTNYTRCIEHEAIRNSEFCTKNIREWCEHCSGISCFNQIITDNSLYSFYYEKGCELCGKLIYPENYSKLCSDRYLISSGWVESTLAKKPILVLYLPWWDTLNYCIGCINDLSFVSDCQKLCLHCYLIYTGCRYCLTTNVTFGPTNQSQCRKCKRISITTNNMSSGDHNMDEVLYDINFSNVADCMNNVDIDSPYKVYDFLRNFSNSKPKMKWIPHSQIENLIEIAEGGFGTVYKATWLGNDVAVKKFLNSQNISKYFLNELKSLYQCYDNLYIIKYIGITQDPETKECMLIMEYAKGGDLHNYLQKNFAKITWKTKVDILCRISDGLKSIHNKNFIHRDFHSGNILLSSNQKWLICDLGLSQPANNTSLNNNEIYGVIPYIAPEIFKGAAFSKESDVYSMGMIMLELTTGCKPFVNVEHDTDLIYRIIDGKQPEITSDTPKCYSDLMKRCLDLDPLRRPSITEIRNTVYDWYSNYLINFVHYDDKKFEQAERQRIEFEQLFKLFEQFEQAEQAEGKRMEIEQLLEQFKQFKQDGRKRIEFEQFEQAERKRIKLIQSKKLGPEFNEKPHPKAIFISRPLSSITSKSSRSYSSSIITFNTRQGSKYKITSSKLNNDEDYISKDCDFDIDNIQGSAQNINSIQNSLNTQHSSASSAIYTSRPLNELISTVKNFSKKRNIEELEIETRNTGKHIKTDSSLKKLFSIWYDL